MIVQELRTKGGEMWDKVTPSAVADRVLEVMGPFVGREHAVTKDELFERVYGLSETVLHSPLNRHVLNNTLSKALAKCRSRSNCFVLGEHIEGERRYFVVRDDDDAKIYRDQANRRIKGLNKLKRRATQAAKEEWHKQEWTFDSDSGEDA